MKITVANAQEYAALHGLTPVQVDGIPEGLSYKEPDVTIDDITHEGQYIAFLPLHDWSDEKAIVRALSIPALQTRYKLNYVKK